MESRNIWCHMDIDKVDNTSLECEFKYVFVYCFFYLKGGGVIIYVS